MSATGSRWEWQPCTEHSISLPLPERGSEVAGVSSFMKAASIAWLKEFWKLGTGTRSELSLSPSLSTGAGGTKLFSSIKYQCHNFRDDSRDFDFLKGTKFPLQQKVILTFFWSSFGPHVCFCFSNPQHLPKWERGEKNLSNQSNLFSRLMSWH